MAEAIRERKGKNSLDIERQLSCYLPYRQYSGCLGLAAKPIIVFMAAVRSLDKVDDVAGEFCKIGYEYLGEFG